MDLFLSIIEEYGDSAFLIIRDDNNHSGNWMDLRRLFDEVFLNPGINSGEYMGAGYYGPERLEKVTNVAPVILLKWEE